LQHFLQCCFYLNLASKKVEDVKEEIEQLTAAGKQYR